MASESKLKPLRSYSQLKCLAYGTCKFIANYEENSTLISNVSYSLKAADKLIFNDSTNDYIDFERELTICRSNSDCIDFDRCSTDICNQEINICENKLNNLTDCSNCNWISIELETDNYPEETSWTLAALVNKREISVLAGK